MIPILEDLTYGQIIAAAIGSSILYVVLVAIYRLTLHPLAKYPGRFVCKISSWPFYFQCLEGDGHLIQAFEHEKYGPVVRIAPDTLCINTAGALQEIYSNRRANVRKSDWYKTVDAPSGSFSTHSELDHGAHAKRRRVLEHAFSENALKSASGFVIDNVTQFLEHIGKKAKESDEWSEPKLISDWTCFLYYDITGDLAFGESFHAMERGKCEAANDVINGAQFIYPLGFLPFISLIRPFLHYPKFLGLLAGQGAQDEINSFQYAADRIHARLDLESQYAKSSTPPRKDFVHYLLNAKDPVTGKGFTQTQLFADAAMLISAGGDTSSVTLAALLFYLLRHPAALDRLTREIRSTFTDINDIQSPNLSPSNLPYTRACLDEALRLAPAVPAHLPRTILPGGLTIDGHFLPGGTVVGTSAYAIHHNAEYYPDPFDFHPERWLTEDKEQLAKMKSAFCPFTLGSRMCIGRSLAYMELTITLGRMLFMYDIRGAGETGADVGGGSRAAKHPGRRREDEYQLVNFFLAKRKGPLMQFRRRNVPEVAVKAG